MRGVVSRFPLWCLSPAGLIASRPVLVLGLYIVFAFVLTHLPPFLPPGPQRPDPIIGPDKVFHFVGFLVLAYLTLNVLIRHLRPRTAMAATFAACAIYGGMDELTQPPFGRTADWYDWYADLLGAAAGIALYRLVPPFKA